MNRFEKQLADNGALLLKFWFHLSKKRRKKRLKSLSKDPRLSWRVTEQDWKHFELYDEFAVVCEKAIRETSTGEAPWTLVEGADANYREATVGRHILEAIQRRSQRQERPPVEPQPSPAAPESAAQPTILSAADLTKTLAKDAYAEQLGRHQGQLNLLSRKMQRRGVSAVLVFEGWDAAGKGGAIRRVTRALDARSYDIVPVAAPTEEELARHYLWRFWQHLPRAGRITIFDRSWYGRVLVERVEGLAREEEWKRAYREISEFESLLRGHGMAVVKFWLHISKDEQLKRFQAREQTPYKQFKITAEDYRNRERWSEYEQAVEEMIERTSTAEAPWVIVESNDKRHARIKVLKSCHEQIAAAVKQARKNGE